MTETILVTGATGNVGAYLIPLLAARQDCVVRAMTRDPGRHGDTFAQSVQLVAGRFEDAATLHDAMEGVDTVVMMAPPGPDCIQQNQAVIDAARQSGAKKIVRISAIKAAADGRTENTRLHGACDALLQNSGMTYTILRPNYFMQNIFMSLDSIMADNCFYAGMGEGKFAMIDIRDVAESVVTAATTDQFNGEVIEISGPKSICFNEVASVLSEVAGRRITYVAVSPDDVEASILQMGLGDWMANLLKEYSEAYGDGWGDLVTDNVDRLTGHPARSFRNFAEDCLAPSLT